MPVDRLTAEDLLMLWPDETWPQEIGALAILDASNLLDPGGRVRIEALRDVIAARLHLVSRFRQLLYVPRRGLGGPLWVDAPSFDLSDHLRVVPLPDPGDEAALLLATEQLRRRRLDRSRPLWEISFLPGLPENRVGMFVKMHHAIADGIAGVATLGALLDPALGGPAGPARPWTPAPPPAAGDLFADSLRRHIDSLGRAFSALAQPVTSWPGGRRYARSLPRSQGPGQAWTASSAQAATSPSSAATSTWSRRSRMSTA
jgi:diacylglycerol O-acyltransferase / wax synthase